MVDDMMIKVNKRVPILGLVWGKEFGEDDMYDCYIDGKMIIDGCRRHDLRHGAHIVFWETAS